MLLGYKTGFVRPGHIYVYTYPYPNTHTCMSSQTALLSHQVYSIYIISLNHTSTYITFPVHKAKLIDTYHTMTHNIIHVPYIMHKATIITHTKGTGE